MPIGMKLASSRAKKVGDFGGHSCGMMGCFIKDHNIIILFNFVKSMKLMDF